jgi:hypothetical protein
MAHHGDQVTAVGRWLFAFTLVVYLATAGGSLTTTDAVATFEVTRSIVDHGSVAMSGNLLGRDAERGRDGRYYSPFGIGQSLYNVPFYVAAKALQRATGITIGKSDSLAKACVALGETVVAAAIVREVFLLAVAVTASVSTAVLAALTLGLGSILWPYSGFGFNQPLTCLTLLASVRQAYVGVRTRTDWRILLSGAWLGASLLTRHEMVIAALPIVLWLWLERTGAPRIRRVMLFLPGVAGGAAIWLVYNAVRFGNPLDSGYLRDPSPGFGSPIVTGVLALLVSPVASVFLYSPFAILGALGLARSLPRRDRAAALFFSSIVVLFVVFYGNLGNWIGGRSYGSRYLVVVLPYFAIGWAALLVDLRPSVRRWVVGVVLAIGLAVQLPGVLVDYAKVSQSVAGAPQEHPWSWSSAPLVLNAAALRHALPENLRYLTGGAVPPQVAAAGGDRDQSFSQQFRFSLDVWWIYLFYLHALSRVGVALVALVFTAMAAWTGAQLGREMRHTEPSA